MLIRAERMSDIDAVDVLLGRAFGSADHPKPPPEVGLVHRLRRSQAWIPQQALVAEIDDQLVGQCLCTRARVGDEPVLAMGPISVLPNLQGQGVGMALIHEAVDIANQMGESLIGLVGDYEYYGRFGFVAGTSKGILPPDPAWGQYFQVLALDAHVSLTGTFQYAEPFAQLS